MPLTEFWEWLQTLPIAAHIGETVWFPLLESIHVLTGTFVVGSILMVDLRLLGLAGRRYEIPRITAEVVPWTLGASAISVMVGFGLFITRASHYVTNRAFQVKMSLLVLAALNMLVFHLIASRRVVSAAPDLPAPPAVRLAGAASLFLWVGVLLSGRWIGHLL
jgi:hypothetical protein